MSMDVHDEQERFLSAIYQKSKRCYIRKQSGAMLKALLNIPKDELKYLCDLCDIASLRMFAEIIELNSPHPDLKDIFDGELSNTNAGSFVRDTLDVAKLVKLATKLKASSDLVFELGRYLRNSIVYQKICKAELGNSVKTGRKYVRFVKERCDRDVYRSFRTAYAVGLGDLITHGDSFWNVQPNGFEKYCRFHNRYLLDIQEAEIRKVHFDKMGLKSFSTEIEAAISRLKAKGQVSQYLGFNQIDLVDASVILAKQSNYFLLKKVAHCEAWYVVAEANCFLPYDFYEQSGSGLIDYWPKIFSYTKLIYCASEEIKRIINWLESYPSLGHKPVFDNYLVLVPSLHYPVHNSSGEYSFKSVDGSRKFFDNLSKAQASFDEELVAKHVVTPILLGERDGEFYFICYWM